MSKTTSLHVYHAFCTFLRPFLHDYDVKMPTNAFYGVLTGNDEILFLFLHLDMVPRNSTPGRFAYIWQSRLVGIIVIKTEGTQIHFLIYVLVAVASVDLKVLIIAPAVNSPRRRNPEEAL